MTAAARAFGLRGSALRPRLAAVPRHASELVASRLGTSALVRSPPGRVVTFAGVQGGAGVSTVALLACGAVTRASERPAVAIDLAAGTRGGLGGLAGAWSQTSAENTAELVIAGGRLARPYTQTQDGVHIISAEPQAVVAIDQAARKLLYATAEAVERHATDSELAALARAGANDAAIEEFAGANPATQRAALHKLVQAARAPHSLVAIDLGLADDELLACHAVVSDLHVWVVVARRDDLEVARRRLLSHEAVADRELVLAWQPDGERVGSRGLRSLGEARGCPVARLARFDRAGSWVEREQMCRSGLEALCRQLR
ncbi:MAG: hypothetical protein QOI98_3274 [Solirubrobacteraceae bacterium]|nr:hypothetical protein [Solirubrobacteraceae bacterium]